MSEKFTKKQLLELAKSKPINITAHSGELIVPVLYQPQVAKFLKSKHIKLPFNIKELNRLKNKGIEYAIKQKKPFYREKYYARGIMKLKI